MRICIVYDCLYPHTVGGAERWYRELALDLAAAGHEVTYLTRLQWDPAEGADLPGVEVVAVSGGGPLYTADGRRRIGPPLGFGLGVLRHLLRHRRSYDAVHLCAFPYFSLLAARAALAGSGVPVAVDWFEVWTRDYWRGYLGRVGGAIGWAVQRLCARLTPQAFVFSDVHAERLAAEGLRQPAIRLAGLYRGPLSGPPEPSGWIHADMRHESTNGAPTVVFAGRHIPEKRADLVPAAVAAARARIPQLRGLILGDGPERARVLAAIEATGASEFVEAPGFVSAEEVAAALGRATCMLLPSAREGYGLVVIEAAALGTPSVVVAGADNAAAELVEEGVNGHVAAAAEPDAIAAAIVACHDGGGALRERTADWFARRAPELTISGSAQAVADWYAEARR